MWHFIPDSGDRFFAYEDGLVDAVGGLFSLAMFIGFIGIIIAC